MAHSYEAYVTGIICQLKAGETTVLGGPTLPVAIDGQTVAVLEPVTVAALQSPEAVTNLTRWRQENQAWFPEKFTVTPEGTRRWLQTGLLEVSDRMLFWLKAPTGLPIGHIGLFRFNYTDRHCEADNIIRGRKDVLPGVMTPALQALMDWMFTQLDLADLYLKVLADNRRAIRLYYRTGFREVGEVPLYRKVLPDGSLRWVEQRQASDQASDRAYMVMRCLRPPRFGPLRYPERE